MEGHSTLGQGVVLLQLVEHAGLMGLTCCLEGPWGLRPGLRCRGWLILRLGLVLLRLRLVVLLLRGGGTRSGSCTRCLLLLLSSHTRRLGNESARNLNGPSGNWGRSRNRKRPLRHGRSSWDGDGTLGNWSGGLATRRLLGLLDLVLLRGRLVVDLLLVVGSLGGCLLLRCTLLGCLLLRYILLGCLPVLLLGLVLGTRGGGPGTLLLLGTCAGSLLQLRLLSQGLVHEGRGSDCDALSGGLETVAVGAVLDSAHLAGVVDEAVLSLDVSVGVLGLDLEGSVSALEAVSVGTVVVVSAIR